MSDIADASAQTRLQKAERRRKGFLVFSCAVALAALLYGAWWWMAR
jgi:multidrug resistance efflux pump